MSNSMLTVSNSEFGKLEILMEDGKELFPAKECARILGYSILTVQCAIIARGV